MINKLFDTHCHFDSIEDAKDQLPRAYEQGLRAINVIGCDVETTKRSIDVVKLVEECRDELGLDGLDAKATMGLHPHEAQHLEQQEKELETLLEENVDLISGIGETGFDFYYNHSSKEDQTNSFIWQIDLAKRFNKAMVIHTRDAWDETFQLLEQQGWPEKSVFHCFTGTQVEALKGIENGVYISISGIATFKNAQDIREAIAAVPLDKLICETDAPWLAPVPHRGKPNEPRYLEYVAQQVIEVRIENCGETAEQVENALFENAVRLFR